MPISKIKRTAINDDGITSSKILDGTIATADIADGAITTAKIANNAVTDAKATITVSPTAVSDQANTSTGGLSLPTGTTAQRPGSPDTGESRMNTTTGSLEFYDGSTWVSTNLIPTVDSLSGNIVAGFGTTLTLTISNGTGSVDVVFKEGSTTLATVTNRTVSSGSATVAVPSGVYGQTAGDTIIVSVLNADGTPSSNSQSTVVKSLPLVEQ